MKFEDMTLKCVDCGQDFVFTAGEQLFFSNKQFKNQPKRCKACKQKRSPQQKSAFSKQETTVTCAGCGQQTTIPFRPTQGRPVFCRECFGQKKTVSASGS